jgi:hypothetical protein
MWCRSVSFFIPLFSSLLRAVAAAALSADLDVDTEVDRSAKRPAVARTPARGGKTFHDKMMWHLKQAGLAAQDAFRGAREQSKKAQTAQVGFGRSLTTSLLWLVSAYLVVGRWCNSLAICDFPPSR